MGALTPQDKRQGLLTVKQTDGTNIVQPYTIAMAYNSNGDVEYIGKADLGSSKAAAVWQISKLTYSGSDVTDIQYADGDLAMDNIWDNRASLTYS